MASPYRDRAKLPTTLLKGEILVDKLLWHLSTKEIFRATAVCRSFRDAVKDAAESEHAPLRLWGRMEAQTRHSALPDGLRTPWDPAFKDVPPQEDDERQEEGNAVVEPGAESAKIFLVLKAAQLAEGFFVSYTTTMTVPELLKGITPILHEDVVAVVQALLDHPRTKAPYQPPYQPGLTPVTAPLTPGASQRDTPADASTSGGGGGGGLGVWGALLLAVVCNEGGEGVEALVGWLWERSAHPTSQLPRAGVREFLCSLLVLLRYRAFVRNPLSSAPMIHAPIMSALQYEEAVEVQEANQWVKGVEVWRDVVTPCPSKYAGTGGVCSRPCGAPLTCEQQSIIQTALPFTVREDGDLVYPLPFPDRKVSIKAFAGCGKTSTLKALAEAHPTIRFLYTAYNRHVVEAAGRAFPPNVDCRTTHKLAHGARRHLEGLGKRFKPEALSNGFVCGAVKFYCRARYGNRGVNLAAGSVIKKTLDKFLASPDEEISEGHLPPRGDIPSNVGLERTLLVDLAQHLWDRMKSPTDTFVPFSFNAYLHLFMEGNPVLVDGSGRPYDCILVDEAQDLNGVTRRLLLSQPHYKILVGDTHQHIYSFNHCCDALGDPAIAWDRHFTLSSSFRVGPQIAAVANRLLLALKQERGLLLGMGPPGGVVYQPVVHYRPVEEFVQAPLLGRPPHITPDCPLTLPALELLHPKVAQLSDRSEQQVCFIARTNAGWFELGVGLALAQERAEAEEKIAEQAYRVALQEQEQRQEGEGRGGRVDSGEVGDAPAEEGQEEVPLNSAAVGSQLSETRLLKEQAAQRAAQVHRECSYFLAALDNRSSSCLLFDRVRDVHGFIYGAPSQRPQSLSHYQSDHELRINVESGLDMELKAALKLVDRYREHTMQYIGMVRQRAALSSSDAAYVLGTAHKFKGEEFGFVQLASDFWRLSKEGQPSQSSDHDVLDDYNCLYVAVTRAQHGLILNVDLGAWMARTTAGRVLSVHVRNTKRLRQVSMRGDIELEEDGQDTTDELESLKFVCSACFAVFHTHDDVELDIFCDEHLLCAKCAQGTMLAELATLRAPPVRRRLELY